MLDDQTRLNQTNEDESVKFAEAQANKELSGSKEPQVKRAESIADLVRDVVGATSYVDKHKYGDDRRDDSDLSEGEE